MPESAEDRDMALVREACKALSGHFDTVQIFCTRVSPREDGTVNVHQGEGNWFARYGQVAHWVKLQDALDGSRAIRRDEADDDE